MLQDFNKMKTYVVEGTDGTIGTVADVYFNDQTWNVQYVAVNTGNWLEGRHLLIAKECLSALKRETSAYPASVSHAQAKASPEFEINQPLSWGKEREICSFYRWSAYYPINENEMSVFPGILTSTNGLKDFSLLANDGEIGKVVNFIVDDTDLLLRYFVVDTAKWLAGRKVLISPMWGKSINWTEQLIEVDVSKESIQESPEYDPLVPIDQVYEVGLYEHYGKPQYW
ncbi:PRC-barrel domain-containing protein [Candidatus Nitrospira salsa]